MCVYLQIYFKEWLTRWWELASPKSAGQAGMLETKGRVGVAESKGSLQAGFLFPQCS